MLNLEDYPAKDHGYLQAHYGATQMLHRGEIKAFCAGFNHDMGRTIHIETDQGWDPDPMFREHNELGYSPPSH
ncbi:hypothetical protein [Rubrivivax gelatinosus]|uniref:hypothetical protein n=1 Tax=Rubrivivax gelatinosus TaxID=28068 RepID=UPI0002F9D2D8|nr:hypothetical protein [Rubrivivax gelatinosus]MBG6083193.1 hypothetical protein [Rubrivivax gelatinosus]